jgi:hypothetical protein
MTDFDLARERTGAEALPPPELEMAGQRKANQGQLQAASCKLQKSKK